MGSVFSANETSKTSGLKILCFGDSLTAGFCFGGSKFFPYSSQLQSLGKVCTNGMSGWTTKQMVDNCHKSTCADFLQTQGKGLAVLLKDRKYDWVFILGGTNDLGMGVDNDDVFSNLCRLVEICVNAKVKHVGVLTVPACGAEFKMPALQSKRAALNAAIGDLPSRYAAVAGKTKVVGIDICELLPNGKKDSFDDEAVAALWDTDRLHFSEAGSAKLGDFLRQFILDYQNE